MSSTEIITKNENTFCNCDFYCDTLEVIEE